LREAKPDIHAGGDLPMTRTPLRLMAILLIAAGANAQAQQADGPTLAQRKNCMACHATTQPLMGPSFRAIADKYAARSDAASYLAQTIVKGSVGVWGNVPMPANTQLTGAEAGTLAHWILSLK
jgi:cytochrome c